jgi:hypothetical protein
MVAFGEFDIAEQPRDEAAFYERSDDITLFVLAGSYHCHNFQDGRARLWDRLAAWGMGIVTGSAPQLGGPERRDAAPREQSFSYGG